VRIFGQVVGVIVEASRVPKAAVKDVLKVAVGEEAGELRKQLDNVTEAAQERPRREEAR
jgi:tRNA-binding EMAP/Myf-like protein